MVCQQVNKEGLCAPLALSAIIGNNVDYWINKLIEIGARNPNIRGTRLVSRHLYQLGFIPILYDIDCVVGDFSSKVHSAKWLVFVDGHVLAVIGKDIIDPVKSENKKVKEAWMYLKSN